MNHFIIINLLKNLENKIGEKISFLSKDNLNYIIEIQMKEKFINNKEDIKIKNLEKLNLELKNYIKKLNEEKIKFNDNLQCITFISKDESICYSVICKKSDKFEKLENKLYERYPQHKNCGNTFLLNGNEINRFKSLKENKICNNGLIVFDNS